MICNTCKKDKPVTCFHIKRNSTRGYCYKCKDCRKEWRENNKEIISLRNKRHRSNNLIGEKERYKLYYQNNRQRRLDYTKQWRIDNIERVRKRDRDVYYDIKHINRKIATSVRKRVIAVLKGESKSESTLQLLDCSIEEFKEHLESQFQPGMNWDNYGKWHIDHILPCSAFELQYSEELEVCFHWTNHQPLWGKYNMQKGSKIMLGGNHYE